MDGSSNIWGSYTQERIYVHHPHYKEQWNHIMLVWSTADPLSTFQHTCLHSLQYSTECLLSCLAVLKSHHFHYFIYQTPPPHTENHSAFPKKGKPVFSIWGVIRNFIAKVQIVLYLKVFVNNELRTRKDKHVLVTKRGWYLMSNSLPIILKIWTWYLKHTVSIYKKNITEVSSPRREYQNTS